MSYNRMGRILALILSVSLLPVVAGCQAVQAEQRAEEPAQPTKARVATRAPSNDGLVWVSRAYPTGDRATSAVLVERGSPAEVLAGQPYDYKIRVTNLTNHALEKVVLADEPQGNFKLSSSKPTPQSTEGSMRWMIGELGPRQSRTVLVTGVPQATGNVAHCAEVSWKSTLCSNTRVVRPALTLTKSATRDAIICDPISFKFTVRNSGSGAARNVVIEDNLPEGLATTDGKRSIRIAVGTLKAGQEKSYSVRTKASKTGRFENTAVARADGGLKAAAGKTLTVVTRPVLTISKTAPKSTFIGRTVDYQMTVKNTGDGPARDTILEDRLPSGASVISVSNRGRHDKGVVRWELGLLNPGESRTVSLRLKSRAAGEFKNSATVKAHCAKAVSATATTQVTGIPAILMEVVDVEDPIEVGNQETYLITVTNQGTAPGTNIRIACELENGMVFRSAGGATAGSGQGRLVTFAALRSLAPKQKATWKVVVRGDAEGDVRFKVRMTSDQLKRPVEETEATNFYR